MTDTTYKIARNKYGYYCVPSSSYTLTSKRILEGKVHEPTTIDFIKKNLGGYDLIHAGTGFGDFLPALSNSNQSTIWAFEPNELNYKSTKETIKLNNLENIQLFQFALGDKDRIGKLKIKENGLDLGVRSSMYLDSVTLNRKKLAFNYIGNSFGSSEI
jgi:hypothetical protein